MFKLLNTTLLILVLSVKLASAYTLEQKFNLYAGGLHGVTGSINITEDNGSYDIKTSTTTHGLIGFLYPATIIYSSNGKLNNGDFIPKLYSTETIVRKSTKEKKVLYDANGIATTKINIKKGITSETDLKDDPKAKDAIDFQTVFAKLLWSYGKNNNCNTQMNVFDGKRRFVVKFTDKGDEKIPANNYSNFSGNARLCEMDITPEDGYPDNSWFWYRNGEKGKQSPVKYWLTKIGDKKIPALVRMEIDSNGFGAIIAHLAEYNIR